MKTRQGFVSNSSSASYIVEIRNIEEQDFFGLLYTEYSWNEFNIHSIKGQIAERIKECNQEIKTEESPLTSFYCSQIKKLEELQKEVLEINDEEDCSRAIKFILKYKDIQYKEVDGDIYLEYFTSMHNSFDEGIGELLKEIIFFFIFETDYKVKCKVDKD
jgi:hypothetical protein